MSDWIFDHLEGIIAAVLAILLVALLAGVVHSIAVGDQERDAFMQECLKDHKQYECTALWRGGEQQGGTYVVPIITPRVR